jgi:hypothetical protein
LEATDDADDAEGEANVRVDLSRLTITVMHRHHIIAMSYIVRGQWDAAMCLAVTLRSVSSPVEIIWPEFDPFFSLTR